MSADAVACEPYTRPYASVTIERLGPCAICHAEVAYFTEVLLYNPDDWSSVTQNTVGFVCMYNKRGFHIIEKPRINADNPAVIQQIARLYYHPETPWRNFHELLPTEAA